MVFEHSENMNMAIEMPLWKRLFSQGAGAAVMLVMIAAAMLSQGRLMAEEQGGVRLISPSDGATIYALHPHLHWQKEDGTNIEDFYRVQVSRDEDHAQQGQLYGDGRYHLDVEGNER